MNKSKSKNKGRRKAAPVLRVSAKPSTPTAQASPANGTPPANRLGLGRKRGPKFRASGGDNPVERRVPVPTQDNDNLQRTHTKYRQGALRRLGLTQQKIQELPRLPRIGHILQHAEGGLATVIAAIRLSDDDEAHSFLEKWDQASPSDRECLVVEDFCAAAELNPKRLLEIAVSALVEDSQSSGAIVAATYHPRVIKRTALAAMTLDGHNDRKLFLQGTGFVPQPRDRQNVFTNNIVMAQQNAIPQAGASTDTQIGPHFNAAEDDLRPVHELIDGNRLLEAPKVVESPSHAVIAHAYKETSEKVDELECIPARSKS